MAPSDHGGDALLVTSLFVGRGLHPRRVWDVDFIWSLKRTHRYLKKERYELLNPIFIYLYLLIYFRSVCLRESGNLRSKHERRLSGARRLRRRLAHELRRRRRRRSGVGRHGLMMMARVNLTVVVFQWRCVVVVVATVRFVSRVHVAHRERERGYGQRRVILMLCADRTGPGLKVRAFYVERLIKGGRSN